MTATAPVAPAPVAPALVAVDAGPFVTLQDTGRIGWQRFGVARSGAMDPDALATANLLVGNPADAAALEFAHVGGAFRLAATSCRIAVAGGFFAVTVAGRPIRPYTTATVLRGQTVRVGASRDAVWGYVAVSNGFDVPLQLGSRSTHARSGIGGLHGRAVRTGDILPLAHDTVHAAPERRLAALPDRRGFLRVVLGPQHDLFTPESLEVFLAGAYTVSNQMDRLGYRLEGPVLQHTHDHNIISDGLVAGCIQVPGSGVPIVLMRDAQLPGGYPKIATVIGADLGRLAQARPGTHVRFQSVSVAQAQAAHASFLASMARRGDDILEVDVGL